MLGQSTRRGASCAIVVASVVAGCDTHLEPLGQAHEEMILASDTSPAAEGAWSECTLPVPDETGWARLDCPDPGPDGQERACIVSYYKNAPELICEMTALCRYDCESDADCPQPQSGDVVPVCDHAQCAMPCDDRSTCPDGMTCHHFSEGEEREQQGSCQYLYICQGEAPAPRP